MKIIVEFREIEETTDNIHSVGGKNRLLNDTAFQFQNFKLNPLKILEPKDLEVILTLYYADSEQIKWAFKNPLQVPDEAKEEIRKLLK
jgi:hypothetical protein